MERRKAPKLIGNTKDHTMLSGKAHLMHHTTPTTTMMIVSNVLYGIPAPFHVLMELEIRVQIVKEDFYINTQ